MKYTAYLEFCKKYNYKPKSKLMFKIENSPLSAFTDTQFSFGCRTWLFFGRLFNYQRKWDKVRDKSLTNSRKALEQAFTPKLREMLNEKN